MTDTVIRPSPLTPPKKQKKNYQAQEIGRLRARVIALEGQLSNYRDTVRRLQKLLHQKKKRTSQPPNPNDWPRDADGREVEA